MKILIETSARHVHVTKEDRDRLFGAGSVLHKTKDLSQPGQFACEERVDLVGPKGMMKRVVILGPERPATQVEISLTDARALGVAVPIRESGVLGGSAGLRLVGPAGEVELGEGVIAAMRHIHATPDDAAKLGVQDKDVVSVRAGTNERALTFGDVVVRVSPSYALAMHIDTDESNAANCAGEVFGELVK